MTQTEPPGAIRLFGGGCVCVSMATTRKSNDTSRNGGKLITFAVAADAARSSRVCVAQFGIWSVAVAIGANKPAGKHKKSAGELPVSPTHRHTKFRFVLITSKQGENGKRVKRFHFTSFHSLYSLATTAG